MTSTDLELSRLALIHRGKVRDVYAADDRRLVMLATDRISAFDVVLPRTIPYKGSVLNLIAAKFLRATSDICPNWLEAVPVPNVSIGRRCTPYKVEMVIRGHLTGHAWRIYRDGGREICGVPLPDGLTEHAPLPEPIITPTTKADHGHDEDISRNRIIADGLVPEREYEMLETHTRALFERGRRMAAERGLILVDTKYEFGSYDGQILLMDEVHTPDSSRYFYAEGFETRREQNLPQRQLSKEFVREWLLDNDFQGKEGQVPPEMTDAKVREISDRYLELYRSITGEDFDKSAADLPAQQAEARVYAALERLSSAAASDNTDL